MPLLYPDTEDGFRSFLMGECSELLQRIPEFAVVGLALNMFTTILLSLLFRIQVVAVFFF